MIPHRPNSCSVIICAYTEKRWDDLIAAVKSIQGQNRPADEIIVVIDHNERLYERARVEIEGIQVLQNREARGLSGARNTGIAAARGQILAFMDEDARADAAWLEKLMSVYEDDLVIGAGGAILPNWIAGRPRWFPEEFNWVVGCTYLGMPTTQAAVRNLIGCNMSFRREVFDVVGNFRSGMGRIGTLPLGCEETELCIRGRQHWPARSFIYHPEARVLHNVPAIRGRFSYFSSRCYSEGLSKAAVARFVGTTDGLSSEQAYTFKTLPRGVLRGLGNLLRGDLSGLGRSAAIIAGLAITTLGYLKGRLSRPAASSNVPAVEADTSQRSFRLLVATPRYFPFSGGVENHVYQTARRLVQQGLSVTVLTTDPGGKLPARETVEGIEIQRVRAWPPRGDLYFAPGLSRLIRGGRWDLVHVQSYHTFVPPLAMRAAHRAGIPYVLTFHGGGHSSGWRNSIRSLQRAWLRPLLANAQRLVAVASFEIDQYGKELRLPAEKFILIPNGSDLPELDEQEKLQPDGNLIVSVGRLERYKGHQRVIAALPHILSARPEARLRIVGAGPYEPTLRELAASLGVADRVEIGAIPPAERKGMARLLSGASLMMLMSDFETHPISALEALAMRVPVLLADNSGMRELAERGWARAVPADSPAQVVAAAALQQLENPIHPEKMEWFSWDDCARDLLRLYRQVLANAKP